MAWCDMVGNKYILVVSRNLQSDCFLEATEQIVTINIWKLKRHCLEIN